MLSEILLDVVSFFDYATLVLFRLTNKQSIRFVDRYADQLAFRRTFTVYSRTGQALGSQLFLEEIRADNSRMPLHLDATDDERLSGAIYVLHLLIDPHAVVEVDLEQFPLSVKPFVEHVPALRHASEVYLDYDGVSPPPLQEYKEIVSLFIRPNRVCFPKIPIEALVAFLESACAAQLEDWSVCAPRADECDELEGLEVSQENIICRSFFDFTNLEQGERKDFTFTGWNLRWDFLRRIIEAADTMQHFITIEVSKPDWVRAESLELGDDFRVSYRRLPLDPTSFEEKSVAIGDFLRSLQHAPKPWTKIACFSKRSDLVVFITCDTITITNNPRHIDWAANHWL